MRHVVVIYGTAVLRAEPLFNTPGCRILDIQKDTYGNPRSPKTSKDYLWHEVEEIPFESSKPLSSLLRAPKTLVAIAVQVWERLGMVRVRSLQLP